jgi:NADPH:quinone reductase-like Zn-dependent oxidoreductase
MITMCLSDAADGPVLIEENVPQPQPGRGELLVRVYAAGVTPTELLWYPTTHAKNGERRGRAVPGHEFSGVIAAMGEETVGFDIGQDVYGMNDWFSDGAMAEYCITQPTSVAQKPPSLTHVEAASVPIGALTAWQGLFDRATPGWRAHTGAWRSRCGWPLRDTARPASWCARDCHCVRTQPCVHIAVGCRTGY